MKNVKRYSEFSNISEQMTYTPLRHYIIGSPVIRVRLSIPINCVTGEEISSVQLNAANTLLSQYVTIHYKIGSDYRMIESDLTVFNHTKKVVAGCTIEETFYVVPVTNKAKTYCGLLR
jgi:hypothetical protein